MTVRIISVALFLVLAPFLGALIEGLERKIIARMQGRVGPPILQPLYDVRKLFHKQVIVVDKTQTLFLVSYMVTQVFAGCIFFFGYDLLLSFFILSTGATFLVFAGSVTNSPYSAIGASRELIQMTAYEPAVLLACVGLYLANGSFNVSEIISAQYSAIMYLPGFFAAYLFILTIKFRKSPFDISTSHHPHQELVKGITTEMGARNLAFYTITEWYEKVFLLGTVAIFIINASYISWAVAVVVVLGTIFFEVLIDATSARVKWDRMSIMSWVITFLVAGLNLMILMLIM